MLYVVWAPIQLSMATKIIRHFVSPYPSRVPDYKAHANRIQPIGTYVLCEANVTHLVTSSAAQTSTDVMYALNSVKELGKSYNDSGKLKYLYLRGGVSAWERIEIFLSNGLVVTGMSDLEVSWWIMSALQLIQAKFRLSENTAGDSDCSSAFDRSNRVVEGIPILFNCCC